MNKNTKLIGLVGYSGVGKNFVSSQLIKHWNEPQHNPVPLETIIEFSLADELKNDVRDFLLDKFKIDILNCSREEKNQVRPVLVEFARIKRKISSGTYYTNILETKHLNNSNIDNVIITDIRYDEYVEDEYSWLKNNNGILIAIERDDIRAPNLDEEINFPKLRNNADLVIRPPFFDSNSEHECREYFFNLSLKIKNIQIKQAIRNN